MKIQFNYDQMSAVKAGLEPGDGTAIIEITPNEVNEYIPLFEKYGNFSGDCLTINSMLKAGLPTFQSLISGLSEKEIQDMEIKEQRRREEEKTKTEYAEKIRKWLANDGRTERDTELNVLNVGLDSTGILSFSYDEYVGMVKFSTQTADKIWVPKFWEDLLPEFAEMKTFWKANEERIKSEVKTENENRKKAALKKFSEENPEKIQAALEKFEQSKRKEAVLKAWVENLGTESQKERFDAGVLDKNEILKLAGNHFFGCIHLPRFDINCNDGTELKNLTDGQWKIRKMFLNTFPKEKFHTEVEFFKNYYEGDPVSVIVKIFVDGWLLREEFLCE